MKQNLSFDINLLVRKLIVLIRRVIRFVVVLYLFACLFVYLFQGYLIFPNYLIDKTVSDSLAKYEIEVLNDKGILLSGWVYENINCGDICAERKSIFYYGGNAEEVSYFISLAKRINIRYLFLMNYRGYGKSEGSPGESEIFADAEYLFDHFTQQKGLSSKDIVVIGRSLGSGVAVHMASKRDLAGVVLITPFDSIVNTAASSYPYLPMFLLIRHRFESDKLAAKIDLPALFLVAEKDRVVFNSQSERLAKLWGGKVYYRTFKDENHATISGSPVYIPMINSFIDRL